MDVGPSGEETGRLEKLGKGRFLFTVLRDTSMLPAWFLGKSNPEFS